MGDKSFNVVWLVVLPSYEQIHPSCIGCILLPSIYSLIEYCRLYKLKINSYLHENGTLLIINTDIKSDIVVLFVCMCIYIYIYIYIFSVNTVYIVLVCYFPHLAYN